MTRDLLTAPPVTVFGHFRRKFPEKNQTNAHSGQGHDEQEGSRYKTV
jgi:hypothetical protein